MHQPIAGLSHPEAPASRLGAMLWQDRRMESQVGLLGCVCLSATFSGCYLSWIPHSVGAGHGENIIAGWTSPIGRPAHGSHSGSPLQRCRLERARRC